ncbi:MAG: hypothetical protein ACRDVG_06910 [Jatrophihabitantaceae bacterium]
MSSHISDDLPRLLTGEASRDVVMAAAAHLRTCVDCQQELTSAVVAHASLTSAQRFAPEVVARRAAPDTDHWRQADAAPGPVPDLSAVFAQVRSEVEADVATEATTAARRPVVRRGALVAAAAAVVLAAGGTGAYLVGRDSASTNGGTSGGRTVALAAYDQGRRSASATIRDGAIMVNATSLPTLANKRYEVWLTNDRRTRLQPIGWVGNDGWAKISVPADILSQYNDLEVSVQSIDQNDYRYSGTSVLRGSIA